MQPRDKVLAQTLARAIAYATAQLIDLGAGTGSMFRFMASIIARPQSWIFADADRSLIEAAFDRTADWAKGLRLQRALTKESRAPALTIGTSTRCLAHPILW